MTVQSITKTIKGPAQRSAATDGCVDFTVESIDINDVSALTIAPAYHTLLFNPGAGFSFSTGIGNCSNEITFGQNCLLGLPDSLPEAFTVNVHNVLRVRIAIGLYTPSPSIHRKESDPLLGSLLNRVADQTTNQVPGNLYLESLKHACLLHLQSHYIEKPVFAPRGKLSSKQLNAVIECVRNAVSADISLAKMADCANLSEFHFARLFRATMGMSPYQFAMQIRIEHAKDLITRDNISLRDVAHHLNFFDQAHFNNAFKKITGFSPRQFAIHNNAQ
jgi:AraC-like DNA-binding protein